MAIVTLCFLEAHASGAALSFWRVRTDGANLSFPRRSNGFTPFQPLQQPFHIIPPMDTKQTLLHLDAVQGGPTAMGCFLRVWVFMYSSTALAEMAKVQLTLPR